MNKKNFLKHIFRPINFLIYSILITLSVCIFILFNTELGLKLSITAAEKMFKGALKIEQATGKLGDKIYIKKMTYTNPTQTIYVKEVTLEWKPLALFEWHLNIENLKINKISILNTSKTQKPALISMPQLPIYLVIKKFEIGEVLLKSEDQRQFLSKALKGALFLTRTQLEGLIKTKLILPAVINTQFELSGNAAHYHFKLSLWEKDFNWKLVGQGDRTHLVFNTLQNDLFKGKLKLTGMVRSPLPSVQLKPASTLSPKLMDTPDKPKEETLLLWKFALEADHVNLQKFFPLVLTGTLTGEGKGSEGRLVLNLSKTSYYNNPISGNAMLRFNYPVIKAFNGEFISNKNTFSMHGKISDEWAIEWLANFNNLELLSTHLKGTLSSKGKISGKLNTPHIEIDLDAKDLKSDLFSSKSISAHLTFNKASLDQSQIEIKASQLKQGFFEVSNLDLFGKIKETDKGLLLTLNLLPGKFQYPFENKVKTEAFSGGFLTTLFTPEKIDSNFDFSLISNSHFKGRALLSNKTQAGSDKKIQASVEGEINDLSFFSGLIGPSVRNIQGQLKTNIQVTGTIEKPDIKSLFTLNAQAFLPVHNLHLKDIQLTAKGEKQTIIYEGHAKSQNTLVNLTGKTDFLPKEVHSQFKITSNDFLMTNTREVKIHIAPNILIESRNEDTRVTGTVYIPQADIKLLDFSNIVTMPEDVRYIEKEKTQTPTPFPVKADLTLVLGDQVYFQHHGLAGNLKGEIKIKSEPMQPTTATGLIKIKNGIYQIKGRTLTINRGYLIFNGGSITNPALQIQATRQIKVNNIGGLDPTMDFGINDMLVGVNLTGNLRHHNVKLFSEPSGLSQSNILSYLITGQSAQAGGSAYAPLLLEAANSLGGGTTSSFSDQIKKGFGLTDISVKQTSTKKIDSKKISTPKETPTLVLGKALSPLFYISYTVNLIHPISGLQIRYQLTKHWLLQISGIPGDKGASIDLIRSFESKN